MDVYKIVITVIALVIVTLLSVMAEMLSKAQETRRASTTGRRNTRPDQRQETLQDETNTLPVPQTRVDGQQNRDSPQSELRKHKGASSEQDR